MELSAENIQPCIDTLIVLHESEAALEKVMELGGLQHRNVSQNAIAGIVRYLTNVRDEMESKP